MMKIESKLFMKCVFSIIQRVILIYNNDNAYRIRFDGLRRLFDRCLDQQTVDHYLHTVVPAMAKLALRITRLFTQVFR